MDPIDHYLRFGRAEGRSGIPPGSLHPAEQEMRDRYEFMAKAFNAIAVNGIEGDYLEFGVARGKTMWAAWSTSGGWACARSSRPSIPSRDCPIRVRRRTEGIRRGKWGDMPSGKTASRQPAVHGRPRRRRDNRRRLLLRLAGRPEAAETALPCRSGLRRLTCTHRLSRFSTTSRTSWQPDRSLPSTIGSAGPRSGGPERNLRCGNCRAHVPNWS